jgi:L-lactate dehydrogenase complex protein LldE
MKSDVKASIMITCLGDLFFPEVGVAMVTVLRRLGVAVDFPGGQTCCGMPLYNSGYHDEAAAVAERTVRLFARRRARGGAVGLLRLDGQDRVPRPPQE